MRRIMKMLQKQTYSSGFSFFTFRLACLFFLAIIITTGTTITTTASNVPRQRGIAAISLTSQSETAAAASEEQQQEPKATERQQLPKEEEEKGVKCKTEQGEDVDWFIVYKLPKIRTSSKALVREGLAYAYLLPPSKARVNVEAQSNVDISAAREYASGHKWSFAGGHERDNLNNNAAATTPIKNKDGNFSTPTGTSSAWTLSDRGIDFPGSMVGQTLGKMYVKGSQDIAYFTYNDQPPVGPTLFSGAHSKGIILTSLASGGIWIQHSVPHFPLIDPDNYNYQYPKTGKINGQVFHCISLSSTKHVDDLAKIFEITKPHVVNFSFPTDSFKKALPQLMSIAHHNKQLENQENNQFNNLSIITDPSSQSSRSMKKDDDNHEDANSKVQAVTAAAEEVPQLPCINEIDESACLNGNLIDDKTVFNNKNEEATTTTLSASTKNFDLMELQSAGGRKFMAYIKGPSFNEDVYSSWIAPTYNTKLEVQSWLNGPHPLTSNCSLPQQSVFNILDKIIVGQSFSTHNDHSKWAISLSTEIPLVCISDLNRMEHQLKRGGVTVCFTDVAVWTTFNNTIIDVQPCPTVSTHTPTVTTTANNNRGAIIDEERSPLLSVVGLVMSHSLSSSSTTSTMTRPSFNGTNDNVAVNFDTDNDSDPKKAHNETKRKRRLDHQHRMSFQQKVKSRTYSFATT